MGDNNNFIDKFHNLQGVKFQERKRNLFYLLNENRHLANSPQLNEIVRDLQPSTHLERVFRVDLLIFYRRFDELLQDYLRGDDITINKLSKQTWFQRKAFQVNDINEFVSKFLPSISYAVRLKFLKRLQCDEEKSDKLFDAVSQEYGIHLAINFIQCCTTEKIASILKDYSRKLNYKQLQIIFQKSPKLIDIYLEQRKQVKPNCFGGEKLILTYIAQTDPDLFCKLREKYSFCIKLGGRTTKKFVTRKKDEILSKPNDYKNILRQDFLVRRLGKDFPQFLLKVFPRKIDEALNDWTINRYLKHLPKNRRFNIFQTTFNAVFYKNLDAKMITEDLLKLIENPVEREKYAKIKYEQDNDLKYLSYYTAQACLDELIPKFGQSTSKKRAEYITIMTDCCSLNKDSDAFLKVLKLLSTRIKNDEQNTHTIFMRQTLDQDGLLAKFSEEHWKALFNITLLIANQIYYTPTRSYCIFKYFEFLFNNQKDITALVTEYGPSHLDHFAHNEFYKFDKNPKFQKTVLSILLTVEVKPKSDGTTDNYTTTLLEYAAKYNKKNRQDPITPIANSYIIGVVRRILHYPKGEYTHCKPKPGLKYVVFNAPDPAVRTELKQLYFEKFIDCTQMYGEIPDVFQQEPEYVLKYFDEIFSEYRQRPMTCRRKTYLIFKNYTHLGLDRKLIDFLFQKLNSDFDVKKMLIEGLSLLLPPSEFMDLVKKYRPTTPKVDLMDNEAKEKYLVQCAAVSGLKDLRMPIEVMPIVFDFCKGDYLGKALRPLYSAVYNLPENEARKIAEELSTNAALSVKKHGTVLKCVISNRRRIIECLQNNPVPVCRYVLKYFVKCPDDVFYSVLKTEISKIEEKDTELLEIIASTLVPVQYRTKYQKTVWEILSKYQKNELKKKLLNQFNPNLELCLKVLDDHFLTMEEIDDFLTNYLLTNVQNGEKIGGYFKKIRVVNTFDAELVLRRRIKQFITKLFKAYMSEKSSIDLTGFKSQFMESYQLLDFFQENILLSLMACKDHQNTEFCGNIILQLNQNIIQQYGNIGLNAFAEILNNNLGSLFKEAEDYFLISWYLFQHKQLVEDVILAIKLLPKFQLQTKKYWENYNNFISTVRNEVDVRVRLELDLYFSNLV